MPKVTRRVPLTWYDSDLTMLAYVRNFVYGDWSLDANEIAWALRGCTGREEGFLARVDVGRENTGV